MFKPPILMQKQGDIQPVISDLSFASRLIRQSPSTPSATSHLCWGTFWMKSRRPSRNADRPPSPPWKPPKSHRGLSGWNNTRSDSYHMLWDSCPLLWTSLCIYWISHSVVFLLKSYKSSICHWFFFPFSTCIPCRSHASSRCSSASSQWMRSVVFGPADFLPLS